MRKLVEEQLKPYVEGLKQSQAITKKLEEGYTPKDITGVYNGGSYLATNNDSGSLLTVKLGGDVPLIAKPGAMVAMDPSMNLRGQLSFSWMKLLTRSGFGKSKITGNGEVMLAPSSLGSIGVIRVNTVEPNPVKGRDPPFTSEWKVGRDAFLAATHAVDSDYQTQNLLQAVFSGEGFFVYTFRGWGPLFVQGLGGVIEKEIADGETFTIDNGYLVAWNCQYKIERVASGGIISGISSREGLACRFMGPGTVFYQTRKIQDVAAHLKKANR
ncbi:AIM24 family protein [Aspergillus ruber CBS 135680]|uniref:Altered inheritance of mitochondria protein 24, mitochondrial n=1 Tax=Aspergillus ruber (strain CBS 135680) TaxID=1388766 RepID=A0A017SQM2_ASPRC|nr:TRAP-like protein [Aspergillus ruber CBS 135680]EYE99277.1 TRAP-like protein [Aspergillus ruber CBS 135680]